MLRTGIALAASLSLLACSDGKDRSQDRPPGDAPEKERTGVLAGRITDIGGAPIAQVVLTHGNAMTTSDEAGLYELELTAGNDLVVELSADGFVNISRHVTVRAGTTSVLFATMMAEGAPQRLDATAGGTVTYGTAGAAMIAPPGAFVNAAGETVTGDIDVYLTPFDPAVAEHFASYPGDMRGITREGESVTLETFGVMDVTVRQNGGDLQIRDGSEVEVIIPAPGFDRPMPDTSQMWTFDAARALWVQNRDDAVYDAASHVFRTKVQHLTPLNCDKPIVPACLTGTVVDESYSPVAGAYVAVEPARGGYVSSDYTDLDGNFCLYVERNEDLIVRVETRLSDACPPERVENGKCVTRRTTGAARTPVSGDYPMDCSADCQRLPQSIRLGEADPGPLDEAACIAVAGTFNDPFAGTCASGLGELYTCFAPEGACTYEIDPLGGEFATNLTEFENGSKMVSGFSPIYGPITTMYGPDAHGNPECGKTYMSFTGDGTIISTASGERYTVRTTGSGGMEIECDGGIAFTLTPEQADFLAGCSGAAEGGGGVQCSAKPGTFGAQCVSDFECEENGYACCGGGAFDESNRCYLPSVCDMLCSIDADCEGSLLCCDPDLGYSVCMPEEACY